jgi:hypothetical protein
MMCTKCNCIFSWGTLEVQTSGIIHNPYFYQLDPEARARVQAALGQAQPVCEQAELAALSSQLAELVKGNAELRVETAECARYMLHVRLAHHANVDSLRTRRAELAPGARDLELAWRWPRLQLLVGQRISEVPNAKAYTRKDYIADMRRIETAHSKKLNLADVQLDFFDTAPLLAAGAVAAGSVEAASDLLHMLMAMRRRAKTYDPLYWHQAQAPVQAEEDWASEEDAIDLGDYSSEDEELAI